MGIRTTGITATGTTRNPNDEPSDICRAMSVLRADPNQRKWGHIPPQAGLAVAVATPVIIRTFNVTFERGIGELHTSRGNKEQVS